MNKFLKSNFFKFAKFWTNNFSVNQLFREPVVLLGLFTNINYFLNFWRTFRLFEEFKRIRTIERLKEFF